MPITSAYFQAGQTCYLGSEAHLSLEVVSTHFAQDPPEK